MAMQVQQREQPTRTETATDNFDGKSSKMEQAPSPESKDQQSLEHHQDMGTLDQTIEGLKRSLKVSKKKKKTVVPVVRDDLTLRIEKIMATGFDDAFKELSPVEQQEFKIKGERAAMEIRQLLRATRVRAKKIFRVLIDWLKFLPGINRYYLIQEAKIKTDQIMTLKNQ